MKVNRIELDKAKGLTIQVVNGVKQQTIFLDGDKITITVVGPGGTSTIEQTPTSVTVTADQFIVNAKNIVETATMDALIRSGASSIMLTPATITETSPEIALTAEANLNMTSATITAEAEAAFNVATVGIASVEAGNFNVTALTGVEIEAPNIALVGMIEFL